MFCNEGDVNKCHGKGAFALHHAWPWAEYEGGRVEYWRGREHNGAVIFYRADNGSPERSRWFRHPGAALADLAASGYRIPGVRDKGIPNLF
jgi:hypothetical protein